ncbi:polysaccharide pyruvyl transferase family protein [Nostocaceae cyanobacterium CENA357]|uniref:Polysaccharide pyruvyl transferase family protein n=1 Tax=Atlanticothrix silvestris CENA357 TaxID=1725252 RepID=A0A8J7HDJ0_9CYAN|nr:polysaccharide pyruvyl transferase family protein [Atlanticothrix silvestris]MBH8551089.1 polysaccharide pyruvyl transferase family protein [Atlanticothrix silvestris CENA357]
MKIGIMTFHHIDNYGATLQAYALWSFLRDQGYEVEIIDYRPYKAIRYYTKGFSPITENFRINLKVFTNILRSWKMRKFLLSHIKLSTKKFYLKKALQQVSTKYDVIICGSDQIWCLDSFRGFNSAFFLDFASNKTTRKVSYAASFGHTKTLGSNRDKVCKLIEQFQTILVRDSNSLQIIKNQCNREAKKVLDPTFLIQYDTINQAPQLKDNYLLIYNQAPLKQSEIDFIKSVVRVRNLNIVAVGKYNKLAQINVETASLKEWIGLYSQASYIVTNTYHGTIFSIIFKKPFNVFIAGNKINKINDLLEDLGLENRIFLADLKPQLVSEQIFDIDYDSVFKILESKIRESKKYLLEAIMQEQKADSFK